MGSTWFRDRRDYTAFLVDWKSKKRKISESAITKQIIQQTIVVSIMELIWGSCRHFTKKYNSLGFYGTTIAPRSRQIWLVSIDFPSLKFLKYHVKTRGELLCKQTKSKTTLQEDLVNFVLLMQKLLSFFYYTHIEIWVMVHIRILRWAEV